MRPRIKSMIWNIRKQKTNKKTQTTQNKKKKESGKNEDSISSLWDNFKRSNGHIIGLPEEKRQSKKLGIYLKK